MQENVTQAVDFHSNDVNEVMNRPPVWIIRSGMGLFILIFLILAYVAWLIKYPERVVGEIKIDVISTGWDKRLQIDTGQVIANMNVSQADIEKIMPDQVVTVSLVSYSASEFRNIAGKVVSIADQANPDNYSFQVKIKWPADGNTGLKKGMHAKIGMTGMGMIKIKETRLISKLFYFN